eukprot:s1104_g23.t2
MFVFGDDTGLPKLDESNIQGHLEQSVAIFYADGNFDFIRSCWSVGDTDCMVAILPWLFGSVLLQAASQEDFPKGLLTIEPGEGDVEPRHAVAVVRVAKGSKRHTLLADLAQEEDLRHLLAIGANFQKGRTGPWAHEAEGSHTVAESCNGRTSLTVHRYRYDPLDYDGKWTKSGIFSWLQKVSYPPVNHLPQFAPTKFLTKNPFDILLVVKPVGAHGPELAKALEPHAARLSHKLKVSFFAKTPTTQQLCDIYGVQTSDEFLLIEKPQEIGPVKRSHSHMPRPPKYRVENLTAGDVDHFFHQYESGLLPRYLMSKGKVQPTHEGLRHLTGRDFVEVVQDPKVSVLVEFVSENCEACNEFDAAYREVARKVQNRQLLQGRTPSMSHVVIARIDQSNNEHTELIKGTPWLRFWPRSIRSVKDGRKRSTDVELRSVDAILEFLDEQDMARQPQMIAE